MDEIKDYVGAPITLGAIIAFIYDNYGGTPRFKHGLVTGFTKGGSVRIRYTHKYRTKGYEDTRKLPKYIIVI